ncbi:alpha/beta fold hydrolase [Desulfosporosinus youngiae]|uniref:Putative hydrolase or acyltransferase of alpha/beta superfamily n=1 Tax=Desulfosporosinus youngiae DSM 17734 TaxID=768710 RepID=H5XW77_9FIRM|nr:alpha/beta hydrolase [Desulfosporosinus youngiae]EHQ90670.1 putative hydrolase or acyltransferase of alpha/beta superfamily [Desulfosporosinus youngiae DSM 17734]
MNKQVTFEQVSLNTECFGNPDNPAILLIMGAASSMIWWETPFCQLLADQGFFVIRYDNRDTGKSTSYPPGKPEYTFEDLADDAIRVLDSYTVEKAVIMGMSMGGMLTQMIALRHPERVRGIVLLSSMYFAAGAENLPYSSEEVNEFFASFGQNEPENDHELLEYAIRQWRVTNKSSRPKDVEHIRAMLKLDIERAANYASRVNHSYAQVTGDELGRIAEIQTPALVIHGTEDVVIPYIHGEMLAGTIPDSVLYTMEGAGHELHPQDYIPVVKQIVSRFAP